MRTVGGGKNEALLILTNVDVGHADLSKRT